MEHSFDIEVAKRYGVDEAIFIQYLYFWLAKNRANGRHYYDGRYWTYNSARALAELFPYWSEDKIQRMIQRMKKQGLLLTGNYNGSRFDRTQWYTLSDEILGGYFPPCVPQKDEIQSAETENRFRRNAGAIPVTIPVIEPDSIYPPTPHEKSVEGFEAFWRLYPKKKSKGAAEKAWGKIKPDSELVARILEGVARAKTCTDWVKEGGKYIPYPATWLNARGWEDELGPALYGDGDEEGDSL